MSMAEFARSMLRRWYLAVLCLALTAAGAYVTASAVPPAYESTASVVLLPPTSVVTEEGNPYLYMGGLDEALSVLVVKLNSAAESETILGGEPNAAYTVQKDPGAPGPLLYITAEARSSEGSLELLGTVLERLPIGLTEMQDELNVTDEARITALTVVQSDEPTRLVKEQLRVLLGMVAVGLALTVLVTALFDRWMLARAARRAEDPDPEEDVLAESDRPETPAEEPDVGDWDAAGKNLLKGPTESPEYVSSGQP